MSNLPPPDDPFYRAARILRFSGQSQANAQGGGRDAHSAVCDASRGFARIRGSSLLRGKRW